MQNKNGLDRPQKSCEEENCHAVTHPELCESMGKKNGWKLLKIRRTGVEILEWECVFSGKQESFEDIRYE